MALADATAPTSNRLPFDRLGLVVAGLAIGGGVLPFLDGNWLSSARCLAPQQ
jgi:hypothetical protein